MSRSFASTDLRLANPRVLPLASTPEEQLVVALASTHERREALAPVLRDLVASASFERLYELLVRQRLLTLVGERLLALGHPEPPNWFRAGVSEAQESARHRGLYHYALSRKITQVLERNGIAVAPLKGFPLAESLYGDFAARASTDVDLLVPSERLDEAARLVESLGWRGQTEPRLSNGLPLLHLELHHFERPTIELHWRVHWYEDDFSRAALGRSLPGGEAWHALQPVDELVCLLLFYARDGFAGLRQAADVAAWWDRHGSDPSRAEEGLLGEVMEAHPRLRPALTAAARVAADTTGVPAGALTESTRELGARGRLVRRLANPWLVGAQPQIQAEIVMVDGLLSPPAGLGAYIRRQLLPPQDVLRHLLAEVVDTPPTRVRLARYWHALTVLRRFALAVPRLMRR
jgi:hypothetical protein